jgi:hypothetical protein
MQAKRFASSTSALYLAPHFFRHRAGRLFGWLKVAENYADRCTDVNEVGPDADDLNKSQIEKDDAKIGVDDAKALRHFAERNCVQREHGLKIRVSVPVGRFFNGRFHAYFDPSGGKALRDTTL